MERGEPPLNRAGCLGPWRTKLQTMPASTTR